MSRQVRFGLFELDLDSGVLTREGVRIRLQPQPARVLALLVEHAGEVVSRDELRQRIWSDGTFVDFERGLNFCIAQVRSALADAADSPRFIETLPRRGYRFIAPVGASVGSRQSAVGSQLGPPAPADGVRVPAALGLARSRRSWLAAAAIVALAAITSILVAGAWRAVAHRPVRIAVVPFDNETGLDDFDSIARGVADATVARLSTPDRVSRFGVIGNAAALHQPRAFRDLKRIGRALDATHIVLAQMKRDETGVRLIAHLITVADEVHLWARTYDRPAFTLEAQAEIAESIAASVANALDGSPSSSSSRPPTR